MANISFDGVADIEKMLINEAERVQRKGEAALIAGAEVARSAMKETVHVAEGGARSHTQHLRDHIEIGKVEHSTMDGYSVDVYPDGVRDDGQRFAAVGFSLEYGRSNVRPRPWMKPAVKKKQTEIAEAIKKELFNDV